MFLPVINVSGRITVSKFAGRKRLCHENKNNFLSYASSLVERRLETAGVRGSIPRCRANFLLGDGVTVTRQTLNLLDERSNRSCPANLWTKLQVVGLVL